MVINKGNISSTVAMAMMEILYNWAFLCLLLATIMNIRKNISNTFSWQHPTYSFHYTPAIAFECRTRFVLDDFTLDLLSHFHY